MSLSVQDITEIRDLIRQIKDDLRELNPELEKTKTNTALAYAQMNELRVLMRRTLSIVLRLSGNEDLNQLVALMQRVIIIVNQVRIAFMALAAAQAGAGPIGWALFGVTAVSAAVSYYDYTGSYG